MFTLEVQLVVLPGQAVYSGHGVSLEGEERQPQQIDADMVEERGEPFLLPFPCGLPYAVQRLCHALPVLRPERVLPARGFPRPPPFAPPAPLPVARLCSSVSSLLWRGLTSRARTSSATAPRLPDADQTACSPLVGRGISQVPTCSLRA